MTAIPHTANGEGVKGEKQRRTRRRGPHSADDGDLRDLALDLLGNPIPGWTLAEKARLQELISLPEPSEEQKLEERSLMQKRMAIHTEAHAPLASAMELADVIRRDAPALTTSQYAWIVTTLFGERDRMLEVFMTLRTLQHAGEQRIKHRSTGPNDADPPQPASPAPAAR